MIVPCFQTKEAYKKGLIVLLAIGRALVQQTSTETGPIVRCTNGRKAFKNKEILFFVQIVMSHSAWNVLNHSILCTIWLGRKRGLQNRCELRTMVKSDVFVIAV